MAKKEKLVLEELMLEAYLDFDKLYDMAMKDYAVVRSIGITKEDLEENKIKQGLVSDKLKILKDIAAEKTKLVNIIRAVNVAPKDDEGDTKTSANQRMSREEMEQIKNMISNPERHIILED